MAGFTEEQLAALKEAYASGELRVSYGGKTVDYDNAAALARRIAVVEADLNKGAGETPVRHIRVYTGKGT